MEQVETMLEVWTGSSQGSQFHKVVGVRLGDHTLINLTPHEVVVDYPGSEDWDPVVLRIPPSGFVARAEMDSAAREPVHIGVPIRFIRPRAATIPEPRDGVIFVVSSLVAQALKGREDVVAPDTDRARRDERGQIVSVPGFVRYGD
ncbi:MAG: hypothetical protein N2557_07985 [Hydrogenophilus sp.]|nr:hypothetical protein [Hydrogenophilus sp.]